MQAHTKKIAGIELELVREGKGNPILFLHPHLGMRHAAPFVDALSQSAEVLAPSHPGFGKSVLPKGMTTVEDLSYYYLDILDELDLRDVTLVGSSFGGWVASAIAIKNTARIKCMVLMGALGAKLDDERKSAIVDVFSTAPAKLEDLYFHDGAFAEREVPKLPEETRQLMARNHHAAATYAWNPYMCDLKLKGRLHRARVPALVLWGARDVIAPLDYGRAYAAALPRATFETIESAGHFPHMEKPAQTAARILAFAANPA